MKNIILSAFVAVVAMMPIAPAANAGSYDHDNDYSGYEHSYRYKKHRDCWYKKVKWYDDYGYAHWKRVKVCEY